MHGSPLNRWAEVMLATVARPFVGESAVHSLDAALQCFPLENEAMTASIEHLEHQHANETNCGEIRVYKLESPLPEQRVVANSN